MSLIVLVRPARSNIELFAFKNGSSTASIKGILILKQTQKGPRPFKFRLIEGNNEKIMTPGEAVDMLRTADLILMARAGDSSSQEDVKGMLEGYQLEYSWADVCEICAAEGRYSQIDSSSIRYRGIFICENCALSELYREINTNSKKMSEDGVERLFSMLLKTRDLDRIIGFLDPRKMDRELTLFDRVPANQSIEPLRVQDLPMDERLKKLLPDVLMPVQSISVRSGLLNGSDQLVVSATATGKTLIGEMAGIKNILSGRGKMLFLVPLVALANQKSDQFKKKYGQIGLTVSIRVGRSRIKTGKRTGMRSSLDSDIIVGTYEGMDHLLRSGGVKRLGNVGTVVLDEVHMIEDPERGPRLDGLIARLRYLFPQGQFIYLSATVGNSGWLADRLGSTLVEYEERPVPLERHLIFGGQAEKLRLINHMASEEYNRISSKGFRGQTIVFTNSRRNCHRLSEALNIPSAPYHAGLPYKQRRAIEEGFLKGRIPVVVTTAALAAGVDFPASQVIFESLAMGIQWLTTREFLQMQGRAGRPDYHDRGVVVVIAEPDRRFQQGESEDKVAFKLLQGDMPPLSIESGDDAGLEQILATTAISSDLRTLRTVESLRLGGGDVDRLLGYLLDYGYAEVSDQKIKLTRMGRVMITHFLDQEQMVIMWEGIEKEQQPMDILTSLEVFDQAFFVDADRIGTALNIRMPSKVFQGGSMELALSGDSLARLDSTMQKKMINFTVDFLTCSCHDTPYCGCPERKFSEKLLEIRCEGQSPGNMIDVLTSNYGIFAYQGDLIDYLDTACRHLEALQQMAKILGNDTFTTNAERLLRCIAG